MPTNRRNFLKLTGSALSLAALGAASHPVEAQASSQSEQASDGKSDRKLDADNEGWAPPADVQPATRKLRILFLGGTRFLGPHQVQYAMARGHEVTLFNRGKTNPHLFPTVAKLRGDRDDDLSALKDREWDAVVDNSAHIPRWVRTVGEVLKGNVSQYLFVSSTGVYHPYLTVDIGEYSTLATMDDPTVEEVDGDTFGPLKVLCEQEAEQWFPGRTTIIRPHLIVGPGDTSDRFTYWPVRVATGGEVMAPGDTNDPVQLIDVRDLARFCITTLEEGYTGPFNAVGPYSPLTMSALLDGLRATVSNDIGFTWVDAEFLEKHEVMPWSNMPVWIPPEGEYLGMCRIDGSLAFAKGLVLRPLADTSDDTLAWWATLPEERRQKMRSGLTLEREAEVLAAWHAENRG